MTAATTRQDPAEVGALVVAAAAGDRASWAALVELFGGLIWNVARGHRLSEGDAADVSQTTWLRLLEHIDRLEDPSRVGAWLATTARRECLRILALAGRQTLVGDTSFLDLRFADDAELDTQLLALEQRDRIHAALERLPSRCAQLLRVLMAQEVPNYQRVAELMDMPVGSIGPTRARCLVKLRVILAEIDAEHPAGRGGARAAGTQLR